MYLARHIEQCRNDTEKIALCEKKQSNQNKLMFKS